MCVYVRRMPPLVYLFPVRCVYTLLDEAELCFVSGSAQVPFLASVLIPNRRFQVFSLKENCEHSDIDSTKLPGVGIKIMFGKRQCRGGLLKFIHISLYI